MGERHVGLDIGSFAVRAAEVSIDAGVPTLHRFAQITLPARAVEQGEIIDPTAVSDAIKALWAKGGFKSRRVVVGLSTPDVKVRQAEVPAFGPDEVRSALRYETQDVMPFAEEGSVVDFLVQERFDSDGREMLRVLVVAAPLGRIDQSVSAVMAAGLVVEAVDLMPFALVRSLASAGPDSGGEIIVSVGAGLTSVVVHAGGVPLMVRTTAGGGGAITEALAEQLSVPYEQAEAIKRTGATQVGDGGQVAALVDSKLDALVGDIAGSIDYFVAQAAEAPVSRIMLTGAGSLVPGLRERISAQARLPVLPADALTNVALGRTRLTPEQLVAASTSLAGPIGLALAPSADPATRLTALLPDRYLERARRRRQARLSTASVMLLAALLVGAWGYRTFALRSARSQVSDTLQLARAVQRREAPFAPLAKEEASLRVRSAAAAAALATDADGRALLDRISAALPTDVWVQTLAVTFPTAKTPGAVSFSLRGTNPDAPAHFLTGMRAQTATFTQVSVNAIAASTDGPHQIVTFAAQAVLAPGVISARSQSFKVPS